MNVSVLHEKTIPRNIFPIPMRIILSIILSLVFVMSASAKSKADPSFSAKVYMYAISASFNDSTVYITDVQEVDSAYLVKKTFLGGLKRYSEQLDNYFREKNGERRTNTVFFKTTRKKAEKQYVKLRKRYTSGDVKLLVLPTGEFTFTAVRPFIEADEYALHVKKDSLQYSDEMLAYISSTLSSALEGCNNNRSSIASEMRNITSPTASFEARPEEE